MAWAPDGSLVVIDGRRSLRRIDPDGRVRTIAATADEPGPLRDGPLGEARLGSLGAVAVSDDGSIVVVDAGHGCIRWIDPAGVVRTVGGLEPDDRGTPRPRVRFAAPAGVALDGRGGIWVLDHADAGTEAVRITIDGRIDRRVRFDRRRDGGS
jgi:sugar lactone lactonase YvrE